MKKILLFTALVILIGGLVYLNWQARERLREQAVQIELQQKQVQRQIAFIMLRQQVPDFTVEGFSTVSNVIVAQVNIPEGSSHLYVFIGQRWFDLGEGTIK